MIDKNDSQPLPPDSWSRMLLRTPQEWLYRRNLLWPESLAFSAQQRKIVGEAVLYVGKSRARLKVEARALDQVYSYSVAPYEECEGETDSQAVKYMTVHFECTMSMSKVILGAKLN